MIKVMANPLEVMIDPSEEVLKEKVQLMLAELESVMLTIKQQTTQTMIIQ